MPTGRKIKRRKLSLLELASGLDGESKGAVLLEYPGLQFGEIRERHI
ncbi:hypothetical protein [Nitratidesulfovibrio vulgaris]|uniref:Uncharacterized protein n=1 Tax=Nitratidesulfovibrio vulgaris (strain ATCC 29579 / DSM 644 / CCUG 34227 / NCIMB 8303 / VKM B-1760 / Hildenborough) TaxID=882 RepID=Q72CY6_NITV2|nr:hypothetical protein DVU_1145 [Nitratidesulfovibrio vulgaris str. Hildenborough]